MSDDDRAQLILVGALTLAAMLVVLAIVVNSGIYSHNLATRSQDPSVPVLEFQQNVETDVGGIVEQSNEAGAGSTYGTIYGDYEDRTIAWAAGAGMYGAREGEYISVNVDSSPSSGGMEGVQVVHDDPGDQFESASGDADWTVSTAAKVRAFEMTVEPLSSTPFVVEFTDGGPIETVEISESGGDVEVTDGSVTCSVTATAVTIDFTAGTVDGEYCGALTFVDDLPSTHDVEYQNGDLARGTYELTVDRVIDSPGNEAGPFTDAVDAVNYGYQCGVSGTTQSTFYGSAAAGSPYVSPGIYSTDVSLQYQSSQVTYEASERIAPGEAGDSAVYPLLTQFDVVDSAGGDGQFVVSWDSTDPDGSVASVTLVVEDPSGGSTDSFPESASGSRTLTRTVNSGDYRIQITVEDNDGLTRTVTQWHEDDGDATGCAP